MINEERIIQNILNNITTDEELESVYMSVNNIKHKSPITLTKKLNSKLIGDLSSKDFNDKILRKLLNQPLQKDINTSTRISRPDGQNVPLTETQVKRNSQGYIVSNTNKTENLLDVNLVDNMIQKELFENVIDTNFEQIELPFEKENKISKLEKKLNILKDTITDLKSSEEELISDKVDLSVDLKTKEGTIESLNETIEVLNDRFSVTPIEGDIFSITPKYPDKQKEDLDYWIIENGERRRIKNYAMVQLMLDQDKKTLNNIQHLAASNIQKIKRGPDMTVDEMSGNSNNTKSAVENNIFIPDSVLESGFTFKIYWGKMQEDVNDNIGFGRLMHWMWGTGDWGSNLEIPDLAGTGITFGYDRDLRHYLAKHSLWEAAREINIDEATKLKIHLKRLADAKAAYSSIALGHLGRINNQLNFMKFLSDTNNLYRVLFGHSSDLEVTRLAIANRATNLAQQGYTYNSNYLSQPYINALAGIFNNPVTTLPETLDDLNNLRASNGVLNN